MTETRTYPDGVPCWVDVVQPDAEAARAFYGGLFGWEFAEPPGAAGSYLIVTLGGQDVGGILPGSHEAPAWHTYVAVNDAEKAAARVTELGGTVLAPAGQMRPPGRDVT